MSPAKRKHLTLAGVLTAASAIGAALYMGVDKLVELDGKIGTSATATAALIRTDVSILETLKRHEKEIARLSRRRARVAQIDSLSQAAPPPSEGLVRRLFRLIF